MSGTKAGQSNQHPVSQRRDFMKRYSYYRFALYVFALSFLLHAPCRGCPAEYSDLHSLFFQVFSSPGRWFSETAQAMGVPYIDYKFEYPPVIACIFYSASAVSLRVSEWTGAERSEIFYYVLALMFLLPTYLFYLKATRDTSRFLGTHWSRLALAVAGFGIAYYVVYNFDIIAVAFAMLSLVLLIKGRERSAGLLLGLSVASKMITGVILFPSVLYLIRKSTRSVEGYLVCCLVAITASFGPVFLFAPEGFQEMLHWTGTWYCENCFYVVAVDDLWDVNWRLLSQILMIAVPLGLMLVTRHADDNVELISRSLLMIPAAISFSYIYSPQMNVMIAPAYLLTNGMPALGTLALSDFMNVLVMVFFFRSDLLCSLFGIQPCPTVWARESPIQWIAFSRIVLLWASVSIMTIAMRSNSRAIQGKRRTKAHFPVPAC